VRENPFRDLEENRARRQRVAIDDNSLPDPRVPELVEEICVARASLFFCRYYASNISALDWEIRRLLPLRMKVPGG